MLGKQWVKSWGMYKWAGAAETSNNRGYEAVSNAATMTLQNTEQGHVLCSKGKEQCSSTQIVIVNTFTHGTLEYHSCMYIQPGT